MDFVRMWHTYTKGKWQQLMSTTTTKNWKKLIEEGFGNISHPSIHITHTFSKRKRKKKKNKHPLSLFGWCQLMDTLTATNNNTLQQKQKKKYWQNEKKMRIRPSAYHGSSSSSLDFFLLLAVETFEKKRLREKYITFFHSRFGFCFLLTQTQNRFLFFRETGVTCKIE